MKGKINIFCLLIIINIQYLISQNTPDPNVICPPCSGATCEFVGPTPGSYGFVPSDPEWFHEFGVEYFDNNTRSCIYEIHFKIRKCVCPSGDTIWDIYVGKIELDPACQQSDYNQIMINAVRRLLLYTPVYFLNQEELNRILNRWSVSIQMSPCWREDTYRPDPNGPVLKRLVPCSSNVCCKTKYWVERHPLTNEFWLVNKERIDLSPVVCSNVIGGGCTFRCDLNDVPFGRLGESFDNPLCSLLDPCPDVPWNSDPVTFFEGWPGVGEDKIYLRLFYAHVKDYNDNERTYYYSVKTKTCPTTRRHYILLDHIKLACDEPLNITPERIQEIIKKGILGALYFANGYFQVPLNPNNLGPLTVNFIIPQCWKTFARYPYNCYLYLLPCENTGCCSRLLYVHYDEVSYNQNPDPRVYRTNLRVTPSEEGSIRPISPCPLECYDACTTLFDDDIYIGFLQTYPQGEMPWIPKEVGTNFEDAKKDRVPANNDKLNLLQFDGKISISGMVEGKSAYKILLFDILGRIFESISGEIKQNRLYQELNIEKLPFGSYFLVVLLDGEVSYKSNIFLVK